MFPEPPDVDMEDRGQTAGLSLIRTRPSLQGGDDGGRVGQGIPEAEIAQHSSEGSQEHSLVLQDPSVCGGSAEPSGSLSPPTSDCCLA